MDPDAVWHHRLDGSRDEAGSAVWGSVHGKGYFWGANLVRAIVTNGDFTAYVCDSAVTVGAAVWNYLVLSQSTRVTDRQTDGRTDGQTDKRTDGQNYDSQDRPRICSRGKNDL